MERVTQTLGIGGPIFRYRYSDGHLGWLVTDYYHARAVLADPRFSQRPLRYPIDDGGFQDAADPESSGGLLRIDPPDHTRIRRYRRRISPSSAWVNTK